MTLHETIQADLDRFLEVLPDRVRQWLAQSDHLDSLKEVVIDLGRPIGARFIHGFETMDESPALRADIDFVTSRVHEFDRDNRSGIEQTLHRISGIRNRHGEIIGLTCRVGRAVYGTLEIIRDVIESGFNILMLGPPEWGRPRSCERSPACSPMSSTAAWSSLTPTMRSVAAATSPTRRSVAPGACRSPTTAPRRR
jgi:hypothetical protein